MKEESECVNAYPASDGLPTGTVDTSRSDDHVRNSEVLVVLGYELLLLEFRKAVCFTAKFATRFDRTRFV
jgi:hypothetical protein